MLVQNGLAGGVLLGLAAGSMPRHCRRLRVLWEHSRLVLRVGAVLLSLPCSDRLVIVTVTHMIIGRSLTGPWAARASRVDHVCARRCARFPMCTAHAGDREGSA